MRSSIKETIKRWGMNQEFKPKWSSVFFSPSFIQRRYLFKNIQNFVQKYGGNKEILDVGCGKQPYKSLFPEDNYLGIDVREGDGAGGKKTVDKFYDGKNIPYDHSSFDIVISTEVFEHVEYPEKLLKEVHRVLKNDGILYLTMPFVWNEHEEPYDFRRFTLFGHKQILEQNNFKILSIKPTSGAFGTCGQLVSSFFVEIVSSFFNRRKIKSKVIRYLIYRIIIFLICCPIQIFFYTLDLIFRKRGITLGYIVIAQKTKQTFQDSTTWDVGIKSWLTEQSESMVHSWDSSIASYYPEHLEIWKDPVKQLEALKNKWNFLEAVEYLDWNKYLGKNANNTVLDLGAGTGWLSIFLSRYNDVKKIYAVDSCAYNLEVMLPELAKLMEGSNWDKIMPIKGFFTPILTEANFFDLVVASSAMHHAPNLTECMKEVYRVLKPGGYFLILNETPTPSFYMGLLSIIRCAKILRTIIMRRWIPDSPMISESGIITNVYLGDRGYCDWQWKAVIKKEKFSFQKIITPYYSYKDLSQHKFVKLTHFIAQK